jgi:hypothetical protein
MAAGPAGFAATQRLGLERVDLVVRCEAVLSG